MLMLGIDVGGTFTDLHFVGSSNKEVIAKVPSTPEDPVKGVMEAVHSAEVDLGQVSDIMHGSTIATNAVVERKLPTTAFITTQGFRDLIEIGRYHKPELYNPYQSKPKPLIPRRYRYEVPERLESEGGEIEALDQSKALEIAQSLSRQGIHSVAIGFMNSYMNAEHEREMERILLSVDSAFRVSLSSSVLPRIRPLGRFITTILNASLKPLIEDYIVRLEGQMAEEGFSGRLWLVQSNGGLIKRLV